MGLLLLLIRLYELLLVIRVILSWVRIERSNMLVEWLEKLTDPVLEPFRRILPTERLGIDLSPLIVLLLLQMLERIIRQSMW